MKRFLGMAGALMVVAAFIPVDASAQIGETMTATSKSFTADTFDCALAATCNLHVRMYGELDPREINGPAAAVSGYPSWAEKRTRYDGIVQVTSNYPNAKADVCRPWYSVWDGAVNAALPTYISYYGTSSQIINRNEGGGNANAVDCGLNTGALACFGSLDNTLAVPSTGSGQGTLNPEGGLSPVPVPTVVTNGAGTGVSTLSLVGAAPGNNLNLPTLNPAANICINGAVPTFFDDLTATEGPGAIAGIGLYVYSIADGAPFRSLLDLEGNAANLQAVLNNPSAGMACTDNTPTGDCPGVGFIPCGSLVGATCAGDLIAAGGGTFDVPSAAVDAALGGPLGDNLAVFVTKLHYRGSGPGTEADPALNDAARYNPSLVSLFSAASTRVSYTALAARVNFTRITPSGNRVVIDFETVGSSFAKFTIERADDGVTFSPVGTVTATGETNYSFTDTIRGRAPSSATYKIIAEDFDGNLTQVFEAVDLKVKPERGGPRR